MSVSAEKALQQGELSAALTELQDLIRKEPANVKLRVFLFQLLVVSGNWERALTQLNVIKEMDGLALLMVQTYQPAILCEVFRSEVFAGKHTPLIFGEPQQWVALLVEALHLDADGHVEEASTLRNQAFGLAPAISGKINDDDFDWLADADNRLGPIIEAIVNGKYYWIPMTQIRDIAFDEPSDLRDVVWMPAQFTWINGGSASGLVPTRYPGSEQCEDPLIRMARKTEWLEASAGVTHGIGQRLLATEHQDYALMDIRKIQFNPV